jgi:acetyltransferase-like isoleucine patch superfamily enzyme
MTIAGKLITLFPAFIVASALASVGWFAVAPGVWPVLTLLGVLYGLPLAAFRVHEAIWPTERGATPIDRRRYVAWWGAHQLQLIYFAFPVLEVVLRLVPGLFSAWLRLWGAKIGKGVYWTPHFEIADRHLLEVGDHVIFGHQVHMFAHMIKPRDNALSLYVKVIRIETGAFVGAGSIIGPGVRVKAGAMLGAETRGYPDKELP